MTQVPTWSLHEAFIQANLTRGFRYLDLAGSVLNDLSPRFSVINVVAPTGTQLSQPTDKADPYQIRFSSDRIWLHYTALDSLGHIVNTAPTIIRQVAEKIEVERFERVGLRAVYHMPSENIIESWQQISSRVLGGGTLSDYLTRVPREQTPPSLQIPFSLENKEVIVRLYWGRSNQEEATSPTTIRGSIVFDVDIGQMSTGEIVRRRDLPRITNEIAETHHNILFKLGVSLLEELPQ